MARPIWQYSPKDDQLHLIRHAMGGVAEALCPLRVPADGLEEPGDEDQRRCPVCLHAYGAELMSQDEHPEYGLRNLCRHADS